MSGQVGSQRSLMDWLKLLAVVLNGFAIITIIFWIYHAIALFSERYGETYHLPPTISRAISQASIGDPFEFWITLSGILLVFGVGVLGFYYFRLSEGLPTPRPYLRIALSILIPVMFLLQVSSSVGMHMLSAFRIPHQADMHMVGSFQFFGSQAFVIIVFAVINHALLRDQNSLAVLHMQGKLNRNLVRLRFWVCIGAVGLVFVYLCLFLAKDIWPSYEHPTLYWTYTQTEPLVIVVFLFVLALCHLDIFGKPRI